MRIAATVFIFSLRLEPTLSEKNVEISTDCRFPQSTSPTISSAHEKCECDGGLDFVGAFCDVCTSDKGCEAVYGGDLLDPNGLYDNHRCSRDYLVSAQQPIFHTWCAMDNKAVEDALGQQSYIDFQYDSIQDKGHLELLAYRDSSEGRAWTKMFACGGTDCAVRTNDDEVEYACSDYDCELTCEVGKYPCTVALAGIAITMGKSGDDFVYRCNTTDDTCTLKDRVLNSFFHEVNLKSCRVGSCSKSLAVITEDKLEDEGEWNVSIGNITDYEGTSVFAIPNYSLSGVLAALIVVVFVTTLVFMVLMYQKIVTNKNVLVLREMEMTSSQRSTITFENLSYEVNGKQIISKVSGIARAGELTAIMGPSGAGKSTLLDILAMRHMAGKFSGTIAVNSSKQQKKWIGYVDQGDFLSSSLTVFENLLFSALLRLPLHTPTAQKIRRVYEVMSTLQLTDVANTSIGGSGARGVSGGEKRRVSVGMELVNNPRILILDEPTSGLDSYNANVLVECLHDLANKTGTTIIMSIHQPRTNIFFKFDQLYVLHHGECVYGGAVSRLDSYLSSIDNPIPSDYNAADFIIDTLFDHNLSDSMTEQNSSFTTEDSMESFPTFTGRSKFCSEEFIKSELYESLMKDLDNHSTTYTTSMDCKKDQDHSHSPVKLWIWQFFVLSSRNAIDLIRNKRLLLLHFGFAVYFAILLGVIYFDLDMKSLPSIQNRLGAFMMMSVFVSFTSLSALPLFWLDRFLYIHETSNRFYATTAYFYSKVFFDLVPLRVLPALVLGLIAHGMLGLREGHGHLLNFLLPLVLVSSTAASINLLLGILIKNIMTAIFTGIIFLLHFFMMTKLFVNFDSVAIAPVRLLNYVSYFNFGYEAMVQNELVGRVIDDFVVTSGDGVLEYLGFRIDTLQRNIFFLFVYFFISSSLALVALLFGVKERK